MLNTPQRFKRYVFLGVLLLAPLIVLYAQTRNPSTRGPAVGVFIDVIGVIEGGMLKVTGSINDFLFRYVGSVTRSDELIRFRREAVSQQALRAQIAELEYENDVLSGLLRRSETLDGSRPIGARLIGRTGELLSHLARINQGKWGGVYRGDGVIAHQGVVGRVLDSGQGASDVLFLTDPSSVLDVVVQRTRARGLLRGEGREEQYGLRIEDFDRLADVREGDKIVTSGLDPSFPAGLLVGVVVEVSKQVDGLYQSALVKPEVDFSRLDHVLVLIHRQVEPLVRLAGQEKLLTEKNANLHDAKVKEGSAFAPKQSDAESAVSIRKVHRPIPTGRTAKPGPLSIAPTSSPGDITSTLPSAGKNQRSKEDGKANPLDTGSGLPGKSAAKDKKTLANKKIIKQKQQVQSTRASASEKSKPQKPKTETNLPDTQAAQKAGSKKPSTKERKKNKPEVQNPASPPKPAAPTAPIDGERETPDAKKKSDGA